MPPRFLAAVGSMGSDGPPVDTTSGGPGWQQRWKKPKNDLQLQPEIGKIQEFQLVKLPQSKGIEHLWPGIGMGSHVADGRMEVSWMTRMTCLLDDQHLAAPLVSQGTTRDLVSGTSCFCGYKKKEQGFNKKATELHFLTTQTAFCFYTTLEFRENH